MNTSRRSFLKTSGFLSAGLAVSSTSLFSFYTPARRETPFGLQLYTLRDIISDDPEGVIRQVADFGYKQIESYEGPMGMFWRTGTIDFSPLLQLGCENGMEYFIVEQEVYTNTTPLDTVRENAEYMRILEL